MESQQKTTQTNGQTREYFTKEIEGAIREMSEEEMLRELIGIEGTRAWTAILKYNQIRLGHCQSAVFSGDPFKEPTSIARNQGIMLGLSDLQNAIILLKTEQREKAAESAKEEEGT